MSRFEVISSILWGVTLSIGAFTAWVYYCQLGIMDITAKSMEFTAKSMQLTTLIPHLESPMVREARAYIMDHRDEFLADPTAVKDPDVRRKVADVAASFNIAGELVQQGKIDREFIIAHWGHSARRMHEILKGYLDTLRADEGDEYLKGFTWLAEEAAKRPPALHRS